jgi:dimethylglycine dehydrogenase
MTDAAQGPQPALDLATFLIVLAVFLSADSRPDDIPVLLRRSAGRNVSEGCEAIMQKHARVVVIGGGIVGCSVLFHLTKLGWREVALVERKELTAGSTWHAAAGFHALNGDHNVARLQAYTISLYKELQALSGQDVGAHYCGGLNVAASPERWEMLKIEYARNRLLGLSTELVGPADVAKLCPIMDVAGVIGALFDHHEGYVDPAGATHAFAKAARARGATIHRHTKVERLEQNPDGTWRVITDQGLIHAEHVVNAAGLWAREVGRMAGVELPLIPIEHHYLITADVPELQGHGREIPYTADLDGGLYLRQEGRGVLLGVYERRAKPWSLSGTPWDYGQNDLLPPDLDNLAEDLEHGFKRFPGVSAAGIRRIVNGPMTFSPDSNPLVGPIAGRRNYWVACGVMAGFAQGGGIGLALAQWIVNGETDYDIFGMDVARFDPKLTPPYTIARACQAYSRRFHLSYPNESWPAGRPLKTSPLYDLHRSKNAVFGTTYGFEVPMFFAPPGTNPTETPTFHRSNAFFAVRAEYQAARADVAVLDLSATCKLELVGPDAAPFLDHLLATRLPAVGRMGAALALTPNGKLAADLTLARLDTDHFFIFGASYLPGFYVRWLTSQVTSGNVLVRDVTETLAAILVTGPRSQQLLHDALGLDISAADFPDGAVRETALGYAPGMLCRAANTGGLTYELYTPTAYLRGLYERIFAAGSAFGIRDIGVRCYTTLRLESGNGAWQREFSQNYTPAEAGLSALIDIDKGNFIGKRAITSASAPSRRLVRLHIETATTDATGNEPVWLGGEQVGFTTSGCFAYGSDQSMAMAYIDLAKIGLDFRYEVTLLGEPCRARLVELPTRAPGRISCDTSVMGVTT